MELQGFFVFQKQIIQLLLALQSVISVEFDRSTTGIIFRPYVKRIENGVVPSPKSYTRKETTTMLEIISSKFSMITTYGSAEVNDGINLYFENYTARFKTIEHFIAEDAASINKELNKTSLTILIGIWLFDDIAKQENEIGVALKAAETANKIHSKTALGLVVAHSEIGERDKIKRTQQALKTIKKIRYQAQALGLKVGVRHSCFEKGYELGKLLRRIANISDFIICEILPPKHVSYNIRPADAFRYVGVDLLDRREYLRNVNPNIKVMGQTSFPGRNYEPDSWNNMENMKNYWEAADKWASRHNFKLWMFEAIDNPRTAWESTGTFSLNSDCGWWKLKRNSMAALEKGYIEKIYAVIKQAARDSSTKNEDFKENIRDHIAPSSPSIWVDVLVVLFILIVVIFLGTFTMLRLRVKQLENTLTQADLQDFLNGISNVEPVTHDDGTALDIALKFPYDKTFEIPKDTLKISYDKILETGQFGCVCKAILLRDRNIEVAVKMPKFNCPRTTLKSLLHEIKILTFIGKHPNIVCVIGAYTNELSRGKVYIATELCSLGSLKNFLKNSETKSTITLENMTGWSHGIACGMEYFTEKHVVHADLATRNVLLTENKSAKITDFGLSRHLYNYSNYVKSQQEPLPWRWMAIESLKYLEFSSKSDVWSYGITVWEIFSMGTLPYPGLSWNTEFVNTLVNGLRMKCPENCTPEMQEIMEKCWQSNPNERPTFTEIKISLTALLENNDEGKLNEWESAKESPPVYTVLE